jgi:hypothetical protein
MDCGTWLSCRRVWEVGNYVGSEEGHAGGGGMGQSDKSQE